MLRLNQGNFRFEDTNQQPTYQCIDDGPGILVILPDAVADRATAIRCRAGIEPIGKERSITAIGLPTSETDFQLLQQLLEVTYAAVLGQSD
jgi:hypothetical protein